MNRRTRYANPLRNPVAAMLMKRQIVADLRSLQTDAQLHALIGANDSKLIDNAGRLAFITADAARACKLPDTSPDMRIVAGMAHALADLANHHGDRDLHRLAIQSGLLACERLLAQCSPWAIGTAALKVDELINSAAGLTLHDITQPKQNKATA
jgi:hypothetical protein